MMLGVLSMAVCAHGQGVAPGPGARAGDFELPGSWQDWLNTPPITSQHVRGKGLVLWFFEEGCPRCRARWPELYQIARRYEDSPVLFIAVNSGTSRAELSRYLQDVKCDWPVLCDVNRRFEKACAVPEISLNNIMQCFIVTPNGKLQQSRWDDVEGAARQAAQSARWNLERGQVSAPMLKVLKYVEFGNYPRAIEQLKQDYQKPERQASAKFLVDMVKSRAAEHAQQVRTSLDSARPKESYDRIRQHEWMFRGMPLDKQLAETKATLSAQFKPTDQPVAK